MGVDGFNKGKLCLTTMTVFTNKRLSMIHFLDERKADGLRNIHAQLKLYIKFSHHSLIDKLQKYRLATLLDELTAVQTAGLTEQ